MRPGPARVLLLVLLAAAGCKITPETTPQNPAVKKAPGGGNAEAIDKNARDELYYALRLGDRAPERDDNNLNSLPDLLARLNHKLDDILSAGGRPPEVRIACHKDLPSERVHELAKEVK